MKENQKIFRPQEYLRTAIILYPQAWKQIEMFRSSRGKDLPDWPEWCFAPMAASYAVVSGGQTLETALVPDVAKIAALSAWRFSQSFYRFDPALYSQLIETKIDKLPVDVLFRLPEWCVFIETPNMLIGDQKLFGFFAHLEFDINTGRPELRLLLDIDDDLGPHLIGQPLHLNVDTLGEAVDAMIVESQRQMGLSGKTHLMTQVPDGLSDEMVSSLEPLLSLLLYICSEKPDFGDSKPPAKPAPKKTKKGMKLFPPNNHSVWNVGARIGSALRRAFLAKETGQPGEIGGSGRVRPRAHIRKAHWHHYWIGPRDGEREILLKWVPPIAVNVDDVGALPVTVRPVSN